MVLEAVVGGDTVIIKAADKIDRHIARELRAHREWLAPWVSAGRAPPLRQADEDAKILVTQFMPGELVQGSGAELASDTYRQAGALLASLHRQLEVKDPGYWARERESALTWLDKGASHPCRHRDPGERARRVVADASQRPGADSR